MTLTKKLKLTPLIIGLLVMAFCILIISDRAVAAQKSMTVRNISILSIDGDNATVNPGGKKDLKATAGMRLGQGYKIKTGASTMLYFQVDDDKAIKMAANSSVSISKASGKKLNVTLLKGEIFFNIKKPVEDGKSVTFSAGGTSMGIRGTKGGISYNSDGMQQSLGGAFYIYSGQGALWQGPQGGGQAPPPPAIMLQSGQGINIPPGPGLGGLQPRNIDLSNASPFQLVGLSENGGSGGNLPPGLQNQLNNMPFGQLQKQLKEQQDQGNDKQKQREEKLKKEKLKGSNNQIYNYNPNSGEGNNNGGGNHNNHNQSTVSATVVYYNFEATFEHSVPNTYTNGKINNARIIISDSDWGTNEEIRPDTAPVFTLTNENEGTVPTENSFVFDQNANKWTYQFELCTTGTYYLSVMDNSATVFQKTIHIFNEEPLLQLVQPQGYGFGAESNDITVNFSSSLGNDSTLSLDGIVYYCLAKDSPNVFSNISSSDLISAVINNTAPADFASVQNCVALGQGNFDYDNGAYTAGSFNLNDLDYGSAYRVAAIVLDEAGNCSNIIEKFFVTGMENKPELTLSENLDSYDVTVSLSGLSSSVINNYYDESPLVYNYHSYYVFFANGISDFNTNLSGQEMVNNYIGNHTYAMQFDRSESSLCSTITSMIDENNNTQSYYTIINSGQTARFYVVMRYTTKIANEFVD